VNSGRFESVYLYPRALLISLDVNYFNYNSVEKRGNALSYLKIEMDISNAEGSIP